MPNDPGRAFSTGASRSPLGEGPRPRYADQAQEHVIEQFDLLDL
jgi:hypothetical protein